MSIKRQPNSSAPKRRTLRILLLALPCLALAVALIALLPKLGAQPKQASLVTPAPTREAAETPAPVTLRLDAFSSGGDLYALLRDENGASVPGKGFGFEVVYPDGTAFSYNAQEDGSLYLSSLEPGLYTVRLRSGAAYTAAPAPIQVLPLPVETPSLPLYDAGWREADGNIYYVNARNQALRGMHLIDGKLYYFDQNGVKASQLGIDVSYHNQGINWNAVKAQGIDYAILRVGYRGYGTGLLWEDKRFDQYMKAAKAAGMKLGVYFYSSAMNPAEAREEASFVIGLLAGAKLDYPVYFDTELSEDIPPGRHDYLGKAVRTQVIPAFCETIRAAGYTPGVYSNLNFLNNHIPYSVYGPYTTWLASYTRDSKLPTFSRPYDMWQFTASGSVNGIRGVADMNVIF